MDPGDHQPSPSVISDTDVDSDGDSDDAIVEEYHLPPPPPGVYDSFQQARDAINAFTALHGYALVISKNNRKKNKEGHCYWYFMECQRHGVNQNKRKNDLQNLQRDKESLRDGCPMAIWIKAQGILKGRRIPPITDATKWEVIVPGTGYLHNHPSDNPLALSRLRSRQMEVNLPELRKLKKARTRRQRIQPTLAQITTNSTHLITDKDIDNALAKDRYQMLLHHGSRTTQLLKALEGELPGYATRYIYHYRINEEDGRTEFLIILDPIAMKYFEENGDILHFDCTYATNVYKLPLLHIAGKSGENTTVPLGIALLSGEAEPNFIEPLEFLKEQFAEYVNLY